MMTKPGSSGCLGYRDKIPGCFPCPNSGGSHELSFFSGIYMEVDDTSTVD